MSANLFEPVVIERYFNATPQQLFAAWTDADIIKNWLFKSEASRISSVEIDLQGGGAFSIVEETATGELINHFGIYQRVVLPQRLSFTLQVPHHFTGLTNVEVNITPEGDGSLLNFQQTGVNPKLVGGAWQKMFDQLDKVLDT
jgi:uncharacterized protein YndB with AHSA1/START domain